jgi:hypothetical protein
MFSYRFDDGLHDNQFITLCVLAMNNLFRVALQHVMSSGIDCLSFLAFSYLGSCRGSRVSALDAGRPLSGCLARAECNESQGQMGSLVRSVNSPEFVRVCLRSERMSSEPRFLQLGYHCVFVMAEAPALFSVFPLCN